MFLAQAVAPGTQMSNSKFSGAFFLFLLLYLELPRAYKKTLGHIWACSLESGLIQDCAHWKLRTSKSVLISISMHTKLYSRSFLILCLVNSDLEYLIPIFRYNFLSKTYCQLYIAIKYCISKKWIQKEGKRSNLIHLGGI